jgi:hypothetical protein
MTSHPTTQAQAPVVQLRPATGDPILHSVDAAEDTGACVTSVPQLARQVVSRLAPDELPLFEDATTAWASGRLPYQRRRRRGPLTSTIRFGVPIELITADIYAVLTGAVGNLLADLTLEAWRHRGLRSAARHRRRTDQACAVREITLLSSQLPTFRQLCVDHALALRMSRADAEVLADAAVGAAMLALVVPSVRP